MEDFYGILDLGVIVAAGLLGVIISLLVLSLWIFSPVEGGEDE